jgi:hypothetical protein
VIIAVEGTKSFEDYDLFMRGMTVALSTPDIDSDIQVWSLGPHKINSFTAAFCNSSENFLKHKGFRISFYKINSQWFLENISSVNYFAFFSLPKENISRIAKSIQDLNTCELGIFRY